MPRSPRSLPPQGRRAARGRATAAWAVAAAAAAAAVAAPGCASSEVATLRDEADARRAASAWQLGPSSAAEDPELDAALARGVDADAVAQAVARRNPDLVAALERWAGYLERAPQAAALPDPVLRYRYSSMFRMHAYELMQDVPAPWKLAAAAEAALAEARALRADAVEREAMLRAQARVAIATLHLARRELGLVDETLALLARFVEIARSHYTAGTAPQTDVLRAELERDGLAADRAGVAAQVRVAETALNVLLDRRHDAPLGDVSALPDPAPAAPVDSLLALALSESPTLAAARGRTAAADAARDRAAVEWLPDLSFGAAYVRDFGADEDELELTGGLVFPLQWGRLGAVRREAEADARRARAEERSARNAVVDRVVAASARVGAAAERHAVLVRDALPRARQAVDVAEAAYVAGRIDLLALLDLERALIRVQVDRERALAEHAVAHAELEWALGGRAP